MHRGRPTSCPIGQVIVRCVSPGVVATVRGFLRGEPVSDLPAAIDLPPITFTLPSFPPPGE